MGKRRDFWAIDLARSLKMEVKTVCSKNTKESPHIVLDIFKTLVWKY